MVRRRRKLFELFGRHLHNQIVVPLLVASMAVAVIATVLGVVGLEMILDQWFDGATDRAATAALSRFEDAGELLTTDAKLVADDPSVTAALERDDFRVAMTRLAAMRPNMDADYILVLDETGAVVASSGDGTTAMGERLFAADPTRALAVDGVFATFVRVAGRETVSGVRPVTFGGRRYAVVVSRVIDDSYLRQNRIAGVDALVFSIDGEHAAAVFVEPTGTVPPATSSSPDSLQRIRDRHDALEGRLGGDGSGGTILEPRFAIAGEQFDARTERVSFADMGGHGGAGEVIADDPTDAARFVTLVVSDKVRADTKTTTIALIAFWSFVAVIALTWLGSVIARNVSAPLADLSESARRVAEGDFSSKVDISGTNEVAELADAFNAMTESLRERTDTLTKKVLELATLYEMSRALGSTLDLDILLDSVLDSAMRIFNVDSGYVMLRDKASQRLDLRAWRGVASGRPDERAIRSSMSDWVVRQGRPLIFNPPADDTVEQQVDSVTGALAALCVPLISGEGVIGAIAVGSRDREFRFTGDDVRLLSTIANHVTIAIGNIELFSSLQDAYLATVRSLAEAVDAKDPYTRGHSDRVANYARAIAERLGLSGEQCTALEMAAYLHDIGKIGIHEEILLKPGKLDAEEMGQMRHHPLIGANILKPVAFPWPIAPVVRHHHEHFDGAGYPAGLKGEEIPLLARILTVADAFEAMTADRPYRGGRTHVEAVDELRRCAGTHFDPRIVECFEHALRQIGEEEGALRARAVNEVQPEEARAIFIAVADGMFASYRRLGGPRLASNVETVVNDWFEAEGVPAQFKGGHLTADWDKVGAPPEQFALMRLVIEHLAHSMSGATGRSIVDHFYDESIDGLSVRMRELAGLLDLYRRD
ncbi:MAG: HD domain-containing protein [Coriobacteriia bacterium]|nr:HD domain-containing protein [Coriobacteriia bacterium]